MISIEISFRGGVLFPTYSTALQFKVQLADLWGGLEREAESMQTPRLL